MSAGDLVGEVLGADEVEDRGLRMGAGGDDRGSQLLAVGEGDARRHGRRATSIEATSAPVRITAPAASAERAIAVADRAHAADHLAPGARHAVELAERVVEQVVGGARGARAGPDADDAGRGERALEPVVLEPVVEQVADRHREDADQVVDVARPKARAARAGLAQQRQEVAGLLRPERRRLAEQHRAEEAADPGQQLLEAGVGLGVARRVRGDRRLRPGACR